MAKNIFAFRIEVGHRIDTDVWTQEGAPNDDCWYIPHPEGEPTKVEEDELATETITEYTKQASPANCQANPQSWYWDPVNERLYVHTTNSDDPGSGDYLLQSYFWDPYADDSQIVYNGKIFEPYLNSENMPSIKLAVSGYHEGKTVQSFGSVRLINADGRFDSRLSDYVYEAKKAEMRFGEFGAAWGDLILIWEGWTGGIIWTDEYIEIETEDLRSSTISR